MSCVPKESRPWFGGVLWLGKLIFVLLAGREEECFLLIVSIGNHSLWKGTTKKEHNSSFLSDLWIVSE